MAWLAPGLLMLGLLLSLPLTAALVRLGHRLSALDSAGATGHAKTLRAVPNIGGLAIVAAFVLPLAAALLVVSGVLPWSAESVWKGSGAFADRLSEGQRFGWLLVGAVTWLLLAGMVDDRRALGPVPKLVLQMVPALALAWLAEVRPLVGLDGHGPWGTVVSVTLGTLWMVAMANAMNFLDNMDGLAGGVGAIAASLFMAAAIVVEQWFVAGLFGLLAGSLIGFLAFNFLPSSGARIFMGDGGSQPLGLMLAALSLRLVFSDPSDPDYALGTRGYGALAPLIVLAVPLYDLVATSAIRIRQGRSPFVGDQQHLSHRLVQRGFSRRGSVMLIWALAAVVGVGGVSLGSLAPWQATLVGVQTLLALGVLAAAEGLFKS
jgi:UDP-GlcNAc:undecaprenyl-phosphate GlcNAc-1-phosphate transferase